MESIYIKLLEPISCRQKEFVFNLNLFWALLYFLRWRHIVTSYINNLSALQFSADIALDKLSAEMRRAIFQFLVWIYVFMPFF